MSPDPAWDFEMTRAREALASAEADLQAKRHHSAASRAYYAAYHAARALLHTHGVHPKTHTGLISQFLKVLVAPGHMERERGRDLAQLERFRRVADYGQMVEVTPDEARWAVETARGFLQAAEEPRRSG